MVYCQRDVGPSDELLQPRDRAAYGLRREDEAMIRNRHKPRCLRRVRRDVEDDIEGRPCASRKPDLDPE